MNTFYASDAYGSSEARMMSIGQLKHLLDDEELLVPSYQREYVWTKKQQQGYLQTLSQGAPLFGPIINIDQNSGKQYIMDGQNRLFTIYYFLKGDISFENEEDETISYSNMSPSEQRKLNSTNISYTETRDWTKEQCQEFFMNIQSGEKLKNGELIHAKPDNSLTIEIQHIYPYFEALFTNKCSDSGIGLSKACIKRYGHYEIIGTLVHMVRTSEYPARPGKTAFQEFKDWGNEKPEFSLLLPSEWTRDTCVTETKSLLHKYYTILQSVPRSRTGMKLTNHLRLLYFIYKSDIYHNDLNEEIYSKIENLLTRVMNKDDEAYDKIVKLGTGGVDRIYDLYYEIYNY
jgi:hypothetical protein